MSTDVPKRNRTLLMWLRWLKLMSSLSQGYDSRT